MIKKFKDFKINEISGTELVGPMGPGYGDTGLQNKTLDANDTAVIYCELDGNFYTYDDYNNLYGEYLKTGAKPLSGFSKKNIETILHSKIK